MIILKFASNVPSKIYPIHFLPSFLICFLILFCFRFFTFIYCNIFKYNFIKPIKQICTIVIININFL